MSDELLSSPRTEVQPMIEPEIVRQMRVLLARGWGAKRVAKELASPATQFDATSVAVRVLSDKSALEHAA